jgi:hypothetical protein
MPHSYVAFVRGRSAIAVTAAPVRPGSRAGASGPSASLILRSAAAVYSWMERCVSVVCPSRFCLSA